MKRRQIFIIGLALLCGSAVLADTVILKDQRKFTGKVVRVTETEVQIDFGSIDCASDWLADFPWITYPPDGETGVSPGTSIDWTWLDDPVLDEVSVELFMEILRESALFAPTVDKKLPRFQERNFQDPNFPLKHLHKDMSLVEQEGERVGLESRGVRAAREVLEYGLAQGLGDADYSALYQIVDPPA